jgi:hypothetical protein
MDNVDEIDRIIYEELMQGRATRSAERTFKTLLTTMGQAGAQAVVLGCTELDMVIDVDANVLPIYDGTRIHAEARWTGSWAGSRAQRDRAARASGLRSGHVAWAGVRADRAACAGRAANSSATATGSSIRSRSAACATRPRCSSPPMAITIACG